ncbi:MAG: uncharacterized protein QOG64_732 [Acidimicrobiaceae bacterium]|jgi:uncharacterized OB-fold protein|nr:uncharacterized protein [Acidimicrobiaceae bacterium]
MSEGIIESLNEVDIRPVPNTGDHDTAGYWEAAGRGELAIKACNACGQVLHLPKAYCHACGSWDSGWRVVQPTGTLYSWTTTERELRPGFAPPYAVVCVELDDAPGTRLIGYLAGRPDLQIGMQMRAYFEKAQGGVMMPHWEPA